MEICRSIERVDGGYMITGLRFPYGSLTDQGKVIRVTFDEVVEQLAKAANEQEFLAHRRAEKEQRIATDITADDDDDGVGQ